MTTLITSINLAVFLLTTFVSSPAPPAPCLAIKKLPKNAVPISANASTFKELIQNSNVFFDKTLIIDQTLLYQDKVLLLSLPSAWGKSIALDMLKDFLELQLDENGCKILPHTSTKNYKLFTRGEIILPNGQVDYLESPLNIAKKRDVIKNYQGQYPVIKISFKGISCSNYQQMMDGIKSRISELFIQYSYITNSSSNTNQNIVATDLKLFQNTLDGQINSSEVANSISFLSELLYKRFNKNVFILVDDWDAIFCSLLLSLPIPENEVNQTISFFTDLMSNTFTNNKHLEKGILTGTFRGLKLIPDFKPVREFFTISSIFYKLCGASDEEVDKLFHYLNIDNDTRARIDDWYDGYIWRPRPKITVYNPRSIAHFVNTKRIANYRFQYNHSSSDIIRRIVMDPLSREILESFIHLGWGYLKYKQLENRFLFRPFTFAGEKALRTYLYDAGYFKIDRRLSMGIFRRIANYEVRNELCNVIMNYYQNEYKIPSARLNDAVVNLANFIANEDNTSTLLVDDLTSLVPVSRPELIHFIIHFLSSQLTLNYEYRYAELDYIFVARRNIPIADLADDIIQNKERAIIIKVLLDGDDTINALECVKTLRHHLKKPDTIQFIKYIRIDVTPNNTIYVSAETQRVEP